MENACPLSELQKHTHYQGELLTLSVMSMETTAEALISRPRGWGLQTVREQLRDHIPLFCLGVCPPPLTIHTQLHLLKYKFNKIPHLTKEKKDCFAIDHSFNSLSKIAKTACVTDCPTPVFQQMHVLGNRKRTPLWDLCS